MIVPYPGMLQNTLIHLYSFGIRPFIYTVCVKTYLNNVEMNMLASPVQAL